MAHVIAFELGFGPVVLHDLEDTLLVVKRILEDVVLRSFQVFLFPIKFVFLDLLHDREETEVE